MSPTSDSESGTSSAGSSTTADTLLGLLWITLAAVLIDLGDIHHRHQADSLVPVLESLHEWEPYYWEQNRYGMLVALLAMPFRNPLTNLLVQNGITIWFGLLCFPLAVRYMRGSSDDRPKGDSSNHWVWIGLLAAGSFSAVAPGQFQWIFLSTFNIFSTSLALGLLGLVALERLSWPRCLFAALAFGLAAWTNSAIGVLLIFLVAAVALARKLSANEEFDEGRFLLREELPQAGYCVGATIFATKILDRIPHPDYHTTWIEVPHIDTWSYLLTDMARIAWVENASLIPWAVLIGICAAATSLAFIRRPTSGKSAAALFATVLIAMCGYSMAMGILFEGRWRYSAPAMVLVHAAAVAAAVSALSLYKPQMLRCVKIAVCLLFAAIPLRHGAPSLRDVEADLQAKFAIGYEEIVAARCTHVAGEYWKVWPAVFAANWHEYQRGSGRTVWGLAHRSTPTAPLWKAVPREQIKVATFVDDPEGEYFLTLLGDDWQSPERRGSLVIYAAK